MVPRLVAAALAGALLAAGAAHAQDAEPDLRVPGAEARLGWGGGYSSNAWSELHLTVTGGDAYTLTLESATGTLRGGLTPLRAEISVGAGAGVRAERVWVPLFTKRPVKLTLQGPQGARSVTLEPLPDRTVVNASFAESGAYLGRVRADNASGNVEVLAALAGGARLTPSSEFAALPVGALGLGEVRGDGAFSTPSVNLERLALSLAPTARPPARASLALAWWSAGIFLVVLGVYSARRTQWRATAGGAAVAVVVGVLGFVALQPRGVAVVQTRTVLIGAGGWGVQLQLHARFNTTAQDVGLPSGAQVLGALPVVHTMEASRVRAGAWSQVSYWTRPSVARLPLRVDAQGIQNSGADTLTDLYVVGRGNLEPLPQARRAFPPVGETPPWSGGSVEATTLSELLPAGSAIARRGATLLIALPDGGSK